MVQAADGTPRPIWRAHHFIGPGLALSVRTSVCSGPRELLYAVPSPLAQKSREDYRHIRRMDLEDLDKKVVDLEAEQRTATGKTKANLAANVPAIRAQRDAYVRDLQALDTAAPATWDTARANLDKKWETLKEAVDHGR